MAEDRWKHVHELFDRAAFGGLFHESHRERVPHLPDVVASAAGRGQTGGYAALQRVLKEAERDAQSGQ
jgi:hypothetical protein